MLLTRRLRAGILLYALFMAAVFALLLQFYINRVQATARLQETQHQQATASLMAELTKEAVDQESGSYAFATGRTNYTRQEDKVAITVQLQSGQSYRYDFLVKPKPQEDDQKDKLEKDKQATQADGSKPEARETSSIPSDLDAPDSELVPSPSTETGAQPLSSTAP